MVDFDVNFDPRKRQVQDSFENPDGVQKKNKLNIDFRSQLDFAENAKCYVGSKGGSLISPDRRISTSSSNYIESNNMQKLTGDTPPKFSIGKYTMEVEFYRDSEGFKSFWVYQILDEKGEFVDSKDKDFAKFIQEKYGYENLDEMILQEHSLSYDLSNNTVMFKLPNSQFSQVKPITTDSIEAEENSTIYTGMDDIKTISSNEFDYVAQAEEILNLLLEDVKGNPENFRKHVDMLTPDNIKAFYDKLDVFDDNSRPLYLSIFREKSLSNDDKEYFCKKMADCFAKKCENDGYYVDDLKERSKGGISELKKSSFVKINLDYVIDYKYRLVLNHEHDDDPEAISRLLIKDIYATNSVGIPMTGKNFERHIGLINSDNVNGVMSLYARINPDSDDEETLVMAIIKERGLDYDTRVKCVNHIVDALIQKAQKNGVTGLDVLKDEINAELKKQGDTWGFANEDFINSRISQLYRRNEIAAYNKFSKEPVDVNITDPNGKIDKHSKQGNTGDCWLLASIKAIAMQPKGLKILNDSIKVDDKKQTVTVTLKGPNKSYTYTFAQLRDAIELSSGDGDIRAIEMAVNQYFKEEGYVNDRPDIEGNEMNVAYDILTGKGGWDHWYSRGSRAAEWINGDKGKYCIDITDKYINDFNKKNRVTTVSAHHDDIKTASGTINGNETVNLFTNHAYTVASSDKYNVYLINPHDTSVTIAVPKEVFQEFFNYMDQFDL